MLGQTGTFLRRRPINGGTALRAIPTQRVTSWNIGLCGGLVSLRSFRKPGFKIPPADLAALIYGQLFEHENAFWHLPPAQPTPARFKQIVLRQLRSRDHASRNFLMTYR